MNRLEHKEAALRRPACLSSGLRLWVLFGSLVVAGLCGPAVPAADPPPDSGQLVWQRQLRKPARSWNESYGPYAYRDWSYELALDGDRLYVTGNADDSLSAYEAANGRRLWRVFADGPVRMAPAVWDGRVYFVSDDGCLYCVDGGTGERRWRHHGSPHPRRAIGDDRMVSAWPARGAPVVHEGVVYYAAGIWPSMRIHVHALDAVTGKPRWHYDGSEMIEVKDKRGKTQTIRPRDRYVWWCPQGPLTLTEGSIDVPWVGRFDPLSGKMLAVNPKPPGRFREVTGTNSVNEMVVRPDAKTVFRSLRRGGRRWQTTHAGVLRCVADAPEATVTPDPLEKSLPAIDAAARKRATQLLSVTGKRSGYALVLGCGSGELLRALVAQSKLSVIGVDPDAELVGRLRASFADAGLYGRRLHLVAADWTDLALPRHAFELIIVGDDTTVATDEHARELAELIRPYGGVACFAGGDAGAQHLARQTGIERRSSEGLHLAVRPKALAGAGQWTHDLGSERCIPDSDDSILRYPLAVQWWAGESSRIKLHVAKYRPRHKVAQGRMVFYSTGQVIHAWRDTPFPPDYQGFCPLLGAMDVYTGRLLWTRSLPDIADYLQQRFGEQDLGRSRSAVARYRMGGWEPYLPRWVAMGDRVFLACGAICRVMDASTGETIRTIDLGDGDQRCIRVADGVLIALMQTDGDQDLGAWDPATGQPLWRQVGIGSKSGGASRGVMNLVVGDGAVMYPTGTPAEAAIVARDLRTGVELWRHDITALLAQQDGKAQWMKKAGLGINLQYSTKHKVLLVFRDKKGFRLNSLQYGLRHKDGARVWTIEPRRGVNAGFVAENNDVHNGIHIGTGVAQGSSDHHAGSIWSKGRGIRIGSPWGHANCVSVNRSRYLATGRAGGGWYNDLDSHEGQTLGLVRPACVNNFIPADGVLTGTMTLMCGCTPLVTCFGFSNAPELEGKP